MRNILTIGARRLQMRGADATVYACSAGARRACCCERRVTVRDRMKRTDQRKAEAEEGERLILGEREALARTRAQKESNVEGET